MKTATLPLKGVMLDMPDNIAQQGALAVALNLANDADGLKHIEAPQKIFDLANGERLLVIHKVGGYTHYITEWTQTNGTSLFKVTIEHNGNTHSVTKVKVCGISGHVTAIQVIGNTIAFNDNDGIHYLLWKSNAYKLLPQHPPMTHIQFGLDSEVAMSERQYASSIGDINLGNTSLNDPVTENGTTVYKFKDMFDYANAENKDMVKRDIIEPITNMIIGEINKLIAEQTDENRFTMPFFVRYAYEMFDGSFTMHSYPVLMLPTTGKPIFASSKNDDFCFSEETGFGFSGRAFVFSGELEWDVAVPADLDDWKDIITGLSVFVSAPIMSFDQNEDVEGFVRLFTGSITDAKTSVLSGQERFFSLFSVGHQPNDANGVYAMKDFASAYTTSDTQNKLSESERMNYVDTQAVSDPQPFATKVPHTAAIIADNTNFRKQLEECGVFYRIANVTLDELTSTSGAVPIDKGTLNTLTNQQQLTDDYLSHDALAADVAANYNHRLLLAEPSRTPHNTLPPFTMWAKQNAGTVTYNSTNSATDAVWDVRVFIKDANGGGDIIVPMAGCDGTLKSYNNTFLFGDITSTSPLTIQWRTNNLPPFYFYYPNPNAYKAELLCTRAENASGTDGAYFCKWELKLKEHTSLNGAFWLGEFDMQNREHGANEETTLTAASIRAVQARSEIILSEADNPFAFLPQNQNKVGNGSIRALAAAVRPLSEGQFGYANLYAFTTDGVWALQVSTHDGTFSNINPVARDVILDGTQPLSLDNSVIFQTEQGIMLIAGAKTSCISNAIDGDRWNLPELMPAMDALQRRGFWTESQKNEVANVFSDVCLAHIATPGNLAYDYANQRVYFHPDGSAYSWVYNLKTQLWTQATTTVNGVANAYPDCVFTQAGSVVSITRNSPKKAVATLVTRPIALSPGTLCKIREMRLEGVLPKRGGVAVFLYGTRNWIKSTLVASAFGQKLSRISGSPFKAHTIFAVSSNKDNAVTHINTSFEPEMTNKLR